MENPRPRSSSQGASGVLGITARIAVSKVISGSASAGVVVVTARQLGPGGRGVLVLLFTSATFGFLICSLGVNISGRLQLVAPVAPVDSRYYFGLGAALTAMQVGACAVLAVTVLPVLDVRLSAASIVPFAVLGGSVLGGFLVIDALNAYGLSVEAAVVDAVSAIVQLIAALVAATWGARTVDPFVAALTTAYVFQITVGLATLKRAGIAIRPRYGATQWGRLLRGGPPAMFMGLGQMLTFKLDRYLVGFFLAPANVGVYSVAGAFAELLRILPMSMGQPVFHRLASGAASLRDFRRVRLLCLVAMATVAVVMWTAAPVAVRAVFGARYLDAVTPLRILVLGELGLAVFYLDGFSLAGLNRVRDAATAVLAGLVLVVIGDVVLIPAYGLSGAAWASVAAYVAMGVIAYLYLRRQTGRSPEGGPRPSPATAQ